MGNGEGWKSYPPFGSWERELKREREIRTSFPIDSIPSGGVGYAGIRASRAVSI